MANGSRNRTSSTRRRSGVRRPSRTTAMTRTTSTSSGRNSGRGGDGIGKYLVPLGGLALAGILLWPRISRAGQSEVQPLPPTPAPTPGRVPAPVDPLIEPVAAGTYPPQTQPARVNITSGVLNVRSAPSNTASIVSKVQRGTTLGIVEAQAPVPGPGSTKGWLKIRTPRNYDGYVASEYLEIGAAPAATLVAGFYNPQGAGYYR